MTKEYDLAAAPTADPTMQTARVPINLPAPTCTFASDNAAAVHPEVLDEISRVNAGHALAYGNDPTTRSVEHRFAELFDIDPSGSSVLLVWGGSGGNVMALANVARPGGAVLCTDIAHLHVDETAAPERVTGLKLLTSPAQHGKLTPPDIERSSRLLGNQHHPQPVAVSLTQATEIGTVYTADEVAALCEVAHRHDMVVHMDGARLANAVATFGGTVSSLREMTTLAGVDIITFGGTKNGMMYGEAVVFMRPDLARYATYARKQTGQLPSKMRYVAAQFEAMLRDGLWLRTASHANDMALRLHDALQDVGSLRLQAPEANSLYPTLDAGAARTLQNWCPFYEWSPDSGIYRWMTAWDTTPEDVDRFAAGVRSVVTG